MQPFQRTTSENKKARKTPRREHARDVPPQIVVDGQAMELTLDTELKRVQNVAIKRN